MLFDYGLKKGQFNYILIIYLFQIRHFYLKKISKNKLKFALCALHQDLLDNELCLEARTKHLILQICHDLISTLSLVLNILHSTNCSAH